MSEEGVKIFGIIVLVGMFIFGADVVRPFAASIGAEFWTTFWASLESIVIFGLAIILVRWLDSGLLGLAIALAAQISWFCWWPVLSSIACGGCDPDKASSGGLSDYAYYSTSLSVDSLWIRWGVAAVIFAGMLVILVRRYERY